MQVIDAKFCSIIFYETTNIIRISQMTMKEGNVRENFLAFKENDIHHLYTACTAGQNTQ